VIDIELADRWRAARPAVAGVHLDSGACSRQSFAVIEAAAQHARHEAEVGGYVAAEAAGPVLQAGRAAIGSLIGLSADDVVFTTGSGHALDLLLSAWPGERTLACPAGEYGPNLTAMAANGFRVHRLETDPLGRVLVEAAEAELRRRRPALVHLTGVASHRGVVQPIADMAEMCRRVDVPLVVDAAQAFGQVDCDVGADAVYSSSRKWMAGPRGVGFLAVRPDLAGRLGHALESIAAVEANVAAHVGYSIALGEYLAIGPERMRQCLARVGAVARGTLDGVAGWRVVEPADESTAITTLVPPAGVVPATVRARLIERHRIVTTAAEIARAPFELTGPVLRVSPHVDVTAEDLEALAVALADA